MSERRLNSGSWLVIGLLALGFVAGFAALKFRQHPEKPPATRPAPAR